MLVDEPQVEIDLMCPILRALSQARGGFTGARRINPGMYEISSFGSSAFLRSYNHYAGDLSVGCYGVCDFPEQLLDKCPELADPHRRFVVTFTKIVRADEPEHGVWRWHKWGDYIGI